MYCAYSNLLIQGNVRYFFGGGHKSVSCVFGAHLSFKIISVCACVGGYESFLILCGPKCYNGHLFLTLH